ncbi:hypothetical protein [Dactylosporangium sp. NPDC051541]|uniref:hypothetical protein n=1 Tax=Dactylosporangium sp. NPDC051541 TaxID=3363977 RepID=UPI0037B3B0D9
MTSDRWHWGQKAQLLKFNQLEAARRQAESWRTGLTGITVLLSAVLVVKGRDNVSTLAPPYPLLVLLCFLAALAALVVATLAALRAASGVPGDECLLTAEDLEAWSKAETTDVYRWITVARRLTVGGLWLIATGAAVAWLAPANLADPPLVRVDSPTGPICGRMTQLGDGIVRIEVTRGQSRTIHVLPLDSAVTLDVVAAC